MKFKYNDNVKIIDGFHKDRMGCIIDTLYVIGWGRIYKVIYNDSFHGKWFHEESLELNENG